MYSIITAHPMPQCKTPRRTIMEKSIYDNDFTKDEIDCLKKMIYKFRQEEILELYVKRQKEENMQRILTPEHNKKSFLVKVKEWYGRIW
jgi:hypothetical protein